MVIYFKSFIRMGYEAITTIYDPKTNSRSICQSLKKVFESNKIIPNTVHSQLEKRLCVSALTQGYPNTYRPEGLIFQTENKPEYVIPFDMMALTSGTTFTSLDYHSQFLKGSDVFIYDNLEQMIKQYPSSDSAIKDLNNFRERYNLKHIDESSMRYNECCFINNIEITPVALIGKHAAYRMLVKEYPLPLYNSINEFQNRKNNHKTRIEG